jgi:hypothetical protein
MEEPAALVARADEQLYEAKRAGRGRTLPVQAALTMTEPVAAHVVTAEHCLIAR